MDCWKIKVDGKYIDKEFKSINLATEYIIKKEITGKSVRLEAQHKIEKQ